MYSATSSKYTPFLFTLNDKYGSKLGGITMNINGTRFRQNQLFKQLIQKSNSNKSLLEAQLRKDNMTADNKRDSFIRSSVVSSETYTPSIKRNYISQDILIDMNSGKYMIQNGNVVECNGNRFTVDQIPQIDGTNLKEIRAKNNVMDFGSNNYFKYISADGKEHLLYSSKKNGIGSILSEDFRGVPYDKTLQRYASFWKYMMSKDPVYMNLDFTNQEIKAYLNEAGIKQGFFTMKMGGMEATQFYSASKNDAIVQSKERYDEQYEALTSTFHLLSNYAPGDVFKVSGKEYILSESHTLDIPYGEDIFDIEYPKNYWYGRRIN